MTSSLLPTMSTPAHFIKSVAAHLFCLRLPIHPEVSAYAAQFAEVYGATPHGALATAIWEAADGSLGEDAQEWAASHGVEF